LLTKAKQILGNRDIVLKIIITFAILLVFKAGTYIPVPLMDTNYIKTLIASTDFLTVLNAFSGGGLANFSILALGISPYITASIVVQMLQMIIPKLKSWGEEGENGKQKINRVTRYTTIVVSLIQALLIIFSLGSTPDDILGNTLIKYHNMYWVFYLYMALVITAGSAFTMWLADLITRHGIGNGSSMIIVAGIISSIPTMFSVLSRKYLTNPSGLNIFLYILIIVLYVAMILAVVFFEGAVRKVPVQYANRQAGQQGSNIPIKLNSANVIPVIFASTILSIPLTIIGVLNLSTSTSTAAFWINQVFSTSEPIGIALYVLLIIFFSFFYSFMQVDPEKIADNLEKQGAFIPGYRPGEETKQQLSKMLFRITLIGSVYLAIVALVPIIVTKAFGFSSADGSSSIVVGGTSLIIIVGVAIETFKQIETQSETKDYKGFLD